MIKKIKRFILLGIPALPLIPFVLMSSNLLPEDHKEIYKDVNRAYYYDGRDFYIDQYDFSNWLSGVNDNKSLFDLSIPGTHDSAMWSGSGTAWAFGWSFAQTQGLNIENQLKLGIRAFDLRLDDEMWLRHGATYSTIRFWHWMNSAVDFLKKHPTEFIIARVKDEGFDVNNHQLAQKASNLYMDQLRVHEDFIFNPQNKLPHELSWKLKDLRGKIVFINHWHHLVNTSYKGGALYHDLIPQNRLQDSYQVYDLNTKQNLIRENMRNSNNSSINELKFFVNFNSVSSSSGWRPWDYAQYHNKETNKFLNENKDLTKLGIVYFDFPGPSVVQAVFKTNYYLNNDELRESYDKHFSESLEISELRSDSSSFTITGNASNFNLQILRDDFPFYETQISEFATTSFKINTGELFQTNTNYKFKFWKTTPKNMFYESRIYNELEYTKEVVDVHYATDYQNLKASINQAITEFNSQAPQIVRYMNSYFKWRLDGLMYYSAQNRYVLDEMRRIWRQAQQQLNYLKDMIVEHKTKWNEVDSLKNNLNNILNPNLTQLLNKIKDDFNNQLNNVLNSNIDPNRLNLNQISSTLRNHKKKLINLQQLLQNLREKNILNLISNIENNSHDYHFGVSKWINKINVFKNELNQKILKVFEDNYLESNKSDYNIFLEENKVWLQKISNLINQINQKVNEVDFNANEVRIFEQEVRNVITNLLAPNNLFEALQNYNQQINQAKQLLMDDHLFKQENNFIQNSDLKALYINKINDLQQKLSSQKINPIGILELSTKISEINDLKQQILQQTQRINDIKNNINNSLELYDAQKQFFVNKLNQNNINYEIINQIIDEFNLINQKKLISIQQQWNFLNSNQLESYQQEIKNTVDVALIEKVIQKYTLLNQNKGNLKTLYSKFNNYENLLGYQFLEDSKKDDFKITYNRITEELENNNSNETFLNSYNELKKYEIILNQDFYNQINNLINEINDSDKIYNFKKHELINNVKKVLNQQEFDIYLNQKNTLIKNDEILNDLNSFDQLNEIRKNKISQFLQQSNNQEEYDNKKQELFDFYLIYNNALNTLRQNQSYQTSIFYIKNSQEVRQVLDDKFQELNDILFNSSNFISEEINLKERVFKEEIEKAKQTSDIFIKDENIKNALIEYNKKIETINSKINKYNDNIDLKNFLSDFLENINNQISDANNIALNNNATLHEIENQTERIQNLINSFETQIHSLIESYENDKIEQNNFNTFKDQTFYSIENKGFLPDYYINNQNLLLINKPDDVQIRNLELIADNENGTLTLNYEVVYKKFSGTKQQIIGELDSNQKIKQRQELENAKNDYRNLKNLINNWLESVSDKTNERFSNRKYDFIQLVDSYDNTFENNNSNINEIQKIKEELNKEFEQIKIDFFKIEKDLLKDQFLEIKDQVNQLNNNILNKNEIINNIFNELLAQINQSQEIIDNENQEISIIKNKINEIEAIFLNAKNEINLEVEKIKKNNILNKINSLFDLINIQKNRIIDQLNQKDHLNESFNKILNDLKILKNKFNDLDSVTLNSEYNVLENNFNDKNNILNNELSNYFNESVPKINFFVINKENFYASQIKAENIQSNSHDFNIRIANLNLVPEDFEGLLNISLTLTLYSNIKDLSFQIKGFKKKDLKVEEIKELYNKKVEEITNLFEQNLTNYPSIVQTNQDDLNQIKNEVNQEQSFSSYQNAINLLNQLINKTQNEINRQNDFDDFNNKVEQQKVNLNIENKKLLLPSEIKLDNIIFENSEIKAKTINFQYDNDKGELKITILFSKNDFSKEKSFNFTDFKTNNDLNFELIQKLNYYKDQIEIIKNSDINLTDNLQAEIDVFFNKILNLKKDKLLYQRPDYINNEIKKEVNFLIKKIIESNDSNNKNNNEIVNTKLNNLKKEINDLKINVFPRLNQKQIFVNNYQAILNDIEETINSNKNWIEKEVVLNQTIAKKNDINNKVDEETKEYFDLNVEKIKANILNPSLRSSSEITTSDLNFNNEEFLIKISNIVLKPEDDKLTINFNANLKNFSKHKSIEVMGFKKNESNIIEQPKKENSEINPQQKYLWFLVLVPILIVPFVIWFIINKIKRKR